MKVKVVKDDEFGSVYDILVRRFFIWVKVSFVTAGCLEEAKRKANKNLDTLGKTYKKYKSLTWERI